MTGGDWRRGRHGCRDDLEGRFSRSCGGEFDTLFAQRGCYKKVSAFKRPGWKGSVDVLVDACRDRVHEDESS